MENSSRSSPSTPWAEGQGEGAIRKKDSHPHRASQRVRKTSSRESIETEKRLWRLRDRRFADFKFHREYPCGAYFLDFYCPRAKLAIELDGGGRGFPGQRIKGEKREGFLTAKQIKALRFWNHQLRREKEAVLFEIWHELVERTGHVKEIADYLPKPAPSR